MNHDQPESLGGRIRQLREAAGLSVRQLAGRVGVHHSYLAYLEKGERNNPADELVKRLAEALEADASELLMLAHHIKPSTTLPPLRDYFMRKLGTSGNEADVLANLVEYQLHKQRGEDDTTDEGRNTSPD